MCWRIFVDAIKGITSAPQGMVLADGTKCKGIHASALEMHGLVICIFSHVNQFLDLILSGNLLEILKKNILSLCKISTLVLCNVKYK